MSRELKNKPLVEAILEVRWDVAMSNEFPQDPTLRLLLGVYYEKIRGEFPYYEQLPTTAIPDAIATGVVQHRFRTAPDSWPLIQLGPGILTFNSTSDYSWPTFRPQACQALGKFVSSFPNHAALKFNRLALRYIDSVEFDHTQNDAYQFLREKMKVEISLPDELFAGHVVQKRPSGFTWESTFASSDPDGQIHLRFASGQNRERPAIIWDTTFESTDEPIVRCAMFTDEFGSWIDGAHNLVNDCFFKLIEGDLERQFS
ncbi:MAG: TIGR04255 family protein [Planctomycetales bacterium]|nr:TIGR04255 family protein [Planctomycetales bacterium]